MKKFNVISFVFLCAFLLLFRFMASGASFGSFGKVAIILMFIFPILGVVTAIKGEGLMKWVLVTLNGVVFCIIAYAVILGLGMGKA